MTTPDPTAGPDPAELIERAWRALKRRQPFMGDDEDSAWFVSWATREALRAHRYEGPGSKPVTERVEGLEARRHVVRLFGIRVETGDYLGDHVLLLAMEA